MPDIHPTWETRPYAADDGPALLHLMRDAFDRGDLPGRPWYDVVNLLDSMPSSPDDTIVGVADGRVVGFVTPHQQQLVVHPAYRRRGHGTRLVEAGVAFSRDQGEPRLTLAPPPGSGAAEAFSVQMGFSYDSSLWQLCLPPGWEVDQPTFPPSVIARPFGVDEDVARYVGLINAAFSGHPSPIYVTIEAVERAHARPTWDPACTCLVASAADPRPPIAFCRTRVDTDDQGRRVGEISLIGVAEAWRGLGLGRELLRWGVMYLRSQAVQDLTLHVEARNDRALGLYERAGFVRGQEWPRWSRLVPLT